MNSFILSCCSTFDLTKEYLEEKNISCIYFHYSINEKQYNDDLWQTMSPEKFYNTINKPNTDLKTSQVNSEEFIKYFTPFLKEGKDILHVCTSSGLSGVYTSAMIAKKELELTYPERKIYIIDSLSASSGGGLMVDTLAEMRDNGKNIDEIYNWLETNKLKMNHWFFTSNLSFFIKGGRISKASGFIGTFLKICPVLNVNAEGKLVPRLKVRSKERCIDTLVSKMEQNADKSINYSEKCFISHSNCLEDATKLAEKIEQKFKHLNGKVKINNIGPTIGSHTGPGTVALFFWGNSRKD